MTTARRHAMRFKRTLAFAVILSASVCLLLLAGATWPQQPNVGPDAGTGVAVISDKLLFSFGSVMMILAIAGGAWAVKSDLVVLRKELCLHAGNASAHHTTETLETQFLPRREAESEFRHIAETLVRIEGLLADRSPGPPGPPGPPGLPGQTWQRGAGRPGE